MCKSFIWIASLIGCLSLSGSLHVSFLDSVDQQQPQACQADQGLSLPMLKGEANFSKHWQCAEAAYPDLLKLALHERRKKELQSVSAAPNLIFYGDSITEEWRESCMGFECPPVDMSESVILNVTGVHATFQRYFVDRYGSAEVMAVGGDQTRDLLWRLQNGEAPTMTPQAIVLMIGINDLGLTGGAYCHQHGESSFCPRKADEFGTEDAENVYLGIKAIIHEIRQRCSAPILISSIFPTGKDWPRGAFYVPVSHLNNLLKELANLDPGTDFVDCTMVVLDEKTHQINQARMLDWLHPTPEAMELWAQCLTPAIDTIVQGGLH